MKSMAASTIRTLTETLLYTLSIHFRVRFIALTVMTMMTGDGTVFPVIQQRPFLFCFLHTYYYPVQIYQSEHDGS